MKISNKKRVGNYMVFQVATIVFLFCTIILFRYLNDHLLSILVIFITLLVLLYGKLKNRFIFEYENSGEVFSIKSYQWLSAGRKPSFELPQKKILSIAVKKGIFQKYLMILFSSSSGKILRMDIDITFCTENQVNLLFTDITKNIAVRNREGIAVEE